jgi:hypothetical protein
MVWRMNALAALLTMGPVYPLLVLFLRESPQGLLMLPW